MSCGSKNGVVVAVATLGLPLTARTSPIPGPAWTVSAEATASILATVWPWLTVTLLTASLPE
jgi:hypothetical protein